MAFDLLAAVKEELTAKPVVCAILLGSSGAGKSRAMGTFGVKTLYVYSSGEDHGKASAQMADNADIVPLCIDYVKNPSTGEYETLSADAAFQRLCDVLKATDQMAALGIGAIAIDGASEVEAIIRNTKEWKSRCKTKDGKHNTFAETSATIDLFRLVMNELKAAQRKLGIHFVISCILDVKTVAHDGEIQEASPHITGYSVAEDLVRQFGDVLVIGRMEKNGVSKHKLQFGVDVARVAKDANGLVKRSLNYAPRLTGVRDVPNIMEPDFSAIIKLKTDELVKRSK